MVLFTTQKVHKHIHVGANENMVELGHQIPCFGYLPKVDKDLWDRCTPYIHANCDKQNALGAQAGIKARDSGQLAIQNTEVVIST